MEPQNISKQLEQDNKSDQPEKEVAGYAPADLLKAPLQPPEPVTTEPPEMTANSKVKSLMLVAIVLFVVGLLFTTLVNVPLGLMILFLAAVAAATTVFAPIQ